MCGSIRKYNENIMNMCCMQGIPKPEFTEFISLSLRIVPWGTYCTTSILQVKTSKHGKIKCFAKVTELACGGNGNRTWAVHWRSSSTVGICSSHLFTIPTCLWNSSPPPLWTMWFGWRWPRPLATQSRPFRAGHGDWCKDDLSEVHENPPSNLY